MIIIVLVLYAGIQVGGSIIAAVAGVPIYASFIIVFLLLALYWLFFVPKVFKAPNKYEKFGNFFKEIRLIQIKPFYIVLFLGFIAAGVTIGCVTLSSTIATINGGVFNIDFNQFKNQVRESLKEKEKR